MSPNRDEVGLASKVSVKVDFEMLDFEILWSLIESKISFSIPSQSLERVGVINPTKQHFHLLAAILQAYDL